MIKYIMALWCVCFFTGTVWGQSVPVKQDVNPFRVAHRIELLHYNNRMVWWYKLFPDGKDLIENNRLSIPPNQILQQTVINKTQYKEWENALYNPNVCQETMVAGCYEPRDLLVFYNADNSLLGCIEICVTCAGIYTSPGLQHMVVCPERTSALYFLVEQTIANEQNNIDSLF